MSPLSWHNRHWIFSLNFLLPMAKTSFGLHILDIYIYLKNNHFSFKIGLSTLQCHHKKITKWYLSMLNYFSPNAKSWIWIAYRADIHTVSECDPYKGACYIWFYITKIKFSVASIRVKWQLEIQRLF